ncbi:MAG TPA: hypothetical protein VEC12_09455, partial [Bacteroidia bacterium]|nr:hypothetical protein [Bacteroidia bacterium]
MYAIHTEWAGKIDINNNYLSNLTGKPVNGIYIFKEPASCNIYNNVIAGLYSDGGLLKYTISGITLAQPGTFGIYYNTIYLDDSTAIANDFSSCCLDIQFPSTVVDLRNNNFINISATGSTGKRTVLKCGWSYSIISSNSGYNNYYAGTPSSKNLISDLSNISTLAQYKAALYPKEQTSLTELPPFLNVSTHPYDVNLDPNTLTQLESQATPITSPISITTDFNFNTRSATMPDIGAYEGVFKGVDKTAPIISVPKFLSNGIIEPSRNLMNVTITDTSGVMRTSGASPRIYYKKYSEPNAYNGNTNAVSGWKWTEASAVNGNLYDFSIDYSLLKDTLAAGDTIQYFLVATDSAAALNTGTLGAILAGPATSVNLTSAHFPVTNLLYRYTIKGSMHGIVTVGNGGAFPSLTGNNGLFAAVNSSILTDDLTAKIISNTAETGAVGLQSLDKYDNNPYVFKIQPDSSKPYKLAGNVSGNAMIRIGAGRDIIIDGNYEDEGRYLHFENTSNASSSTVIQLGAQQGAAHFANGITIKNCLVSMPNTPANYANMGIQVTNYNPSTTGIEIQNITIENNHIYDAGMGIHVKGEYSSLKTIHNITIRKNQIGYYRGKGTIKINGIYLEYVDSVLIEANHIENISSDGIRLADHARNIKIYTNRISSFGLGLSTFGSSGIHAETGLANSNIEIINNFISDIKFVNVPFNGPGNSNGITVKSVGSSVTGNVKILHNSVRLEGTRPIGVQTAALHVLSGPPIDVRNNILYNTITNVGSSSSKSYGFISGYSFDTTVFAFDYNNIYTTSQGVTGTYKGQDRKTLSDLKASSSTHFQNSISCLPDFYSANDLRVSASCLANSGTPASVPTDIFGKPRSSVSPTIGAYEFIEYTDDIAVTDFIGDVECGTDSHKVTVIVRNVGLVEQSGFTIHLEITGDQTGSASYSYTDTLPSKQNDTVTITTGIASWAGMELDIMASVSLTGDANSSNDSLSHYYNIHAAPVLTTTGDTLCGGGAFSLSASSANSTINWYAGSTATTPVNTGTAFSPVVTATTKYYLVATDTAWQCTSPLDSVYAVVLAIDTVKLGADTNACAGDSINLGQDKTYPAYLWSTGDTTSSITAIVQGIYWLQVTDNNGCISSDTMMVNLSTDCVWPGDATNNGVANIIDILEIALHY